MKANLLGALVCLFAAGPAFPPMFAQDKKKGDDPFADALQPGAEHQLLKKLEGTWEAKLKAWFGPGTPEESAGTMVRKMILDGRYLEEKYTGSVKGRPFQGLGIFGYDLDQKKYFMSWIDNLGTGLLISYGTYDPKTRTWSYVGDEENPQLGKLKTRDVLKMVNDNEMILEMFRTPASTGKEFKIIEIRYTRKKA